MTTFGNVEKNRERVVDRSVECRYTYYMKTNNEVSETSRTIIVGGKPIVLPLTTEAELNRIRLLQFKVAYAKKNRK